MKEALRESTDKLKFMYDYCAYIRRTVMNDPKLAAKGGFTYIDLDTLDEVMIRLAQNEVLLGFKRKGNKVKKGESILDYTTDGLKVTSVTVKKARKK